MPSMQNIVLEDAAVPTPNEVTFKAMSLVNNVGAYQDDSDGPISLWPRITISVRPASSGNQGHKVIAKITLPIPREVEEGSCCVPNGTPQPQNIVTVEFLRSSQSSNTTAADTLAFLQGLVADAQFTQCALGESLR